MIPLDELLACLVGVAPTDARSRWTAPTLGLEGGHVFGGQMIAVGLARQKWPEEWRIVTAFPRTASGKIRKVDLRSALRGTTRGDT